MFEILGLIVIGLVAGLLARAIVPGRDPLGIIGTIVLGIIGSFVGGFLWSLVTGNGFELTTIGFIGSILGAVIALLIYKMAVKPRRA